MHRYRQAAGHMNGRIDPYKVPAEWGPFKRHKIDDVTKELKHR